MLRHPRSRAGGPFRGGFTLIELLVVISIIAVLLALSAAATLRVLGLAPGMATGKALNRVDSRLKQQTAYAADQARKDTINQAVFTTFSLQRSGADLERAKTLWMKLKFKQWFPTTFAEALDANGTLATYGIQPRDGYVKHLQRFNITTSNLNVTDAASESAACLYMILRYGPETTGEDDTSMAGATKLWTFGNTGSQPVPVLADSWGTPLLFCRWPVGTPPNIPPGAPGGASAVNSAGAQPGFNDPLDQNGTLCSAAWITSNGTTFANTFGYQLTPPQGGQPYSLPLTPLVLSAGADRQFGVDPLSLTVTNAGQSNDNLYPSSVKPR